MGIDPDREILNALVESGRNNILACIHNTKECISWMDRNPNGSPESYDQFRVNSLGMYSSLRTIKRKGMSEVRRITEQDIALQYQALSIVS